MKHLSRNARETIDLPGTKVFKSWGRTVNALERAHYNSYEIEAVANTPKILIFAAADYPNGAPFTALLNYLTNCGYIHGSAKINKLIMKVFGKRDGLELNKEGKVCRRGTMPGNYHPNRTILVPVGTPACCDPTSETYWSA